jgi:hypothetical protein
MSKTRDRSKSKDKGLYYQLSKTIRERTTSRSKRQQERHSINSYRLLKIQTLKE